MSLQATPNFTMFAHLRGGFIQSLPNVEHDLDIDQTNILVKNINPRVFTNQMWTDGQRTKTNPKTSPEQSEIFQLIQEINKTNVLTKAKNVTSIVKTAPPPGSHFHDDWAKNVTSRVKLPPPPGSHVIQLTGTIFQLNSRIKETNVVTKFHDNWAKNVPSRVEKCPAHWRPCFFTIWTIFKIVRHMNKTNVLIIFHDDWAKIVTSRVKTAPPTGGHVFQWTGTTFELNQHIINTDI
ncbi:hypothetical protein DPMN_042672 [Dreissena polymorpha]|uniref:Uncharacterized protein n=1 Tax=Dreissena polymorpha TaxID=45954 RepID=A0A9D4CZZ3_DREPO|nr:hypothetical protein DPMN_042672 [Dreissena polymorpha]